MPLIIGFKYKDGVILACDVQTTPEAFPRIAGSRQLVQLTSNIAVAGVGLKGAIQDVIKSALRTVTHYDDQLFDTHIGAFSSANSFWQIENEHKLQKNDIAGADFIVASNNRIRIVFASGYEEEIDEYGCAGSGRAYAEHVLRKHYRQDMLEEEAKKLMAYTFLETSDVDGYTGDSFTAKLLRSGRGCMELTDAEILWLKSQMTDKNLIR